MYGQSSENIYAVSYKGCIWILNEDTYGGNTQTKIFFFLLRSELLKKKKGITPNYDKSHTNRKQK